MSLDELFFRILALTYTVLILCGAVLVPGYIVNSKIGLLIELLTANPDTSLVKIPHARRTNEMPEKDLNLVEREVIWKADASN